MFSPSSATEIAFLMVAVIQAVFAVIWALSAWLVKGTRRAAAHWATWSVLSAVIWITLTIRIESPPLLAVLAGVIGVICLQRGIRIFIERKPRHGLHLALLSAVFVAWWLGTKTSLRYSQAFLNFGVLAWLYFDIARDLYSHARTKLRFKWPWLLALPTALGAIAYGARSLQALLQPSSVVAQMGADSALNVASAFYFVVLGLALHSTLAVLVVARLVAALRRLSRHDGLTDLLNRRAMEEALEHHIQLGKRSGAAFAVMMLDMDHFKRINDQHGHAVGDLALKHVAALLQRLMREQDSLARFGGEEFVILLARTTFDDAEPLAERIRASISESPLTHADEAVPLSISIGLAQWHGAAEDASHLLSRADAALFQAKVQGRNRVVRANRSAA
ncbi:MAG TPA: GGDEF domain-containing protein [Steroidobacteraceae bacterium]|nr:GGDEF domain-containing protein [Steroidobacteraceae bacterium]